MNDLAKNLLTQYYGFGGESSGKRFLTVPQYAENIKNEEEEAEEEIPLETVKENESIGDCQQKDNDDCSTLNDTSESYRRTSEAYDNDENNYNFYENFNITDDINPESDIACDFYENAEQMSNIESPCNCVTPIANTSVEETSGNEANRDDSSLALIINVSQHSNVDVSSTISKKSLEIETLLPSEVKKEPICNETFADYSNTDLKLFPSEILNKFPHIRMLYIADNCLTELPSEIFRSLNHLEWLDVRNNYLTTLPNSVQSHPCLETLLLQGNRIEVLPLGLCTLPKLKTLQVTRNPLISPPKEIAASGITAIMEFLRREWNNAHPDYQVTIKKGKLEPKLSTILCYQSPRKNKKRISLPKVVVPAKTVSSKMKQKYYKPSSRYLNEKAEFLENNIENLLKKESYSLCDSRSQKLNTHINKNVNEPCKAKGITPSNISKDNKNIIDITINNEITMIDNSILKLKGPSPRSAYVRQNVKILKTYHRSTRRECKIRSSVNELNDFIYSSKESYVPSMKDKKQFDDKAEEQIFDIITKDRKRCESKGANIQLEQRLLWFSKLKKMITEQTSILQKIKDEEVLKEWRRDKRSFNVAMEKAMKRNEDDIPFGFNLEDYVSIFNSRSKSKNLTHTRKKTHNFTRLTDINKHINELSESLNQLQIRNADDKTPRSKQNLLLNEMQKLLQCQNEIQNLRKYNNITMMPLTN